MRPPRFLLRTLLIAVAVVGGALGAAIETRNRWHEARFLRLADFYARQAEAYNGWAAVLDRKAADERDPERAAALRREARRYRQKAEGMGSWIRHSQRVARLRWPRIPDDAHLPPLPPRSGDDSPLERGN